MKLGLIDLLPGNLLAAVTGELTHHGNHRATRHVLSAIDRVAGADPGKKFIVLNLVRVALALPAPILFAPNPTGLNRGFAFGAEN